MGKDNFKVMFGGGRGAQTVDEDAEFGYIQPSNIQINLAGVENPKGQSIIGTNPKDTTTKAKIRRGNVIFPNPIMGWGRRLIRNSKGEIITPKESIDVTNREYHGDIDWLKWGDHNGHAIEARYIRNSTSLDYQYQVTRQGLKSKDVDEENNYLIYPSGLKEFNYDTEELLIQHLKIHQNNESSEYRNPDSAFPVSMFREVKSFNVQDVQVKEIDFRFDAGKLIREANSFEKLKVLKSVLERSRSEIVYDETKENDLYETLILYAESSPKQVINTVRDFKADVSKLIELGRAYNAFDCTLNGTIWMTNPSKELLIEDVDAKGDDMLQWLFDNCLEPRVFNAIEKLNLYSQKFKQ